MIPCFQRKSRRMRSDMSATTAAHKLPRPYLHNPKAMSNGSVLHEDSGRQSPMPRSARSSYSDIASPANKLSSYHPRDSSDSSYLRRPVQEVTSSLSATKRVTIASSSSTEEKAHHLTPAERVTQQIYSSVNPLAKSAPSSKSSGSKLFLSHRLPHSELEANLSKARPAELISAYLELADQLKRCERQCDLKEGLLRRTQTELESKDRALREREVIIRRLERDMQKIQEEEEIEQAPENSSVITTGSMISPSGAVRCRYSAAGCPYRLPSMEYHEERKCRFRPTRCPSLTCTSKPPFANILQHIEEDHDGSVHGKDRICRNNTNNLVSSYVNIDTEPIFYKNSRMTWVANELVCEGRHFYLECMRNPPDWHIWVYILGSDREAENFQTTISLYREDEFGRVGDAGYTAQRSYTGQVISIHRSKEEIAEMSLGFQVHDKQIRPLCGQIDGQEEQLFGYEVTVYRKNQ